MILRDFTGGLNIRQAPYLIKSNESLVLTNVDITNETLKPIKELKIYKDDKEYKPYIYEWKDTILDSDNYRTYLEYKNLLLWSEETQKAMKFDGTNTYTLGIENNSSKVELSKIEAPNIDNITITKTVLKAPDCTMQETDGDFPQDTYEYIIVNVDELTYSKETNKTFITSADDKGIIFKNFTNLVTKIKVYRKYEGTYRLVDETADGSDIVDNILDISSNEEYQPNREFELGDNLHYKVVAYDDTNNIYKTKKIDETLDEDDYTSKIEVTFDSSTTDKRLYRNYNGEYRLVEATLKDYKYDISNNGILPNYNQLNGTYSYRYTYYNSNDGTESIPTNISDEIEVDEGLVIVSNIVKSNNPQVDKIRLYRVGSNITTYSLVTELDNENQTYTDNIADIDIDGRILDSYNNYPPVEGIKQLCYHLGYFLGFKDDTMYWSEIGNPNYWSKFNYISFEEEVRGIGLLQGAILVFLPNKTYIIQGTDPSVFVKYLLSNEQGCVSYKSINYASNKIVWASNDGLCTTNGGEILVVSKEKLGKIDIKDVVNSAVLDETYYLLHKDGILVGDGRFGIRFSYYQLDTIANIQQVKTNDTILLYNKEDKHIYKFNGDNYLTMEYLSPKLIDISYTLNKWFQDIYIKYEGKISITFYIDDKEVLVIDELKTDNVKLPASKQRGKSISFKVIGTGRVEEIEFKYKGRENGK